MKQRFEPGYQDFSFGKSYVNGYTIELISNHRVPFKLITFTFRKVGRNGVAIHFEYNQYSPI